jgi:hypothetical protein
MSVEALKEIAKEIKVEKITNQTRLNPYKNISFFDQSSTCSTTSESKSRGDKYEK